MRSTAKSDRWWIYYWSAFFPSFS